MADHWNLVQYFQAHKAEAHATVSRPARPLLPWCLHLLYLLRRCHIPWQPFAESRDLRELLDVMAGLNSHSVSDEELLCSMIRRALNSALAGGGKDQCPGCASLAARAAATPVWVAASSFCYRYCLASLPRRSVGPRITSHMRLRRIPSGGNPQIS